MTLRTRYSKFALKGRSETGESFEAAAQGGLKSIGAPSPNHFYAYSSLGLCRFAYNHERPPYARVGVVVGFGGGEEAKRRLLQRLTVGEFGVLR